MRDNKYVLVVKIRVYVQKGKTACFVIGSSDNLATILVLSTHQYNGA